MKLPNLLLAWLGLEVINVILNIVTVVLLLVIPASGLVALGAGVIPGFVL